MPLGNSPNSGIAYPSYPPVNAICADTLTGNIYVAGFFSSAGNTTVPAKSIAMWDGTTWSALGNGIGPMGGSSQAETFCMVMYNGELILGGQFNSIDGIPAVGVARWNGSSWTAMGDLNSSVRALTIHNGELYAAGDFWMSGGAPCKHIAKWNGISWAQLGPGLGDQPVNPYNTALPIALQSYNGNLFIGAAYGSYMYSGATSMGSCVKWDGTTFTQAGTTIAANAVTDFAVHNGLLYTTQYNFVGGTNMPHVYNGTDFVPAATSGVLANINAIVSFQGKLYIGTNNNAAPCMWYLNGGTITNTSGTSASIGVSGTGYTEVNCFHVFNNELYLGGSFQDAGNTPNVNSVAKYMGPDKPVTAFTMSNNNFCAGSCINFTDNSTNYPSTWQWYFPGSTATSSTSQNPANICYATAGTYTAQLIASNSLGSDTLEKIITVINSPAQPSVIYGNSVVCGSTAQTFSVAPVPGTTAYTWSVPGGWSGSSTTNVITYTIGGTGGTIFVTANNACGTSPARSLSVSIGTGPPNQPSNIIGSAGCCTGSTQTYSVALVAGASSYTWVLPGGWTGTSSTNIITPTANLASGTISVTANNGCGSSSVQTLSVIVNPLPVITVNSGAICAGQSFTMIPSGASTYTYTGGSATVSPMSSATYSVTGTDLNGCSSLSPAVSAVTVNSLPIISVNSGSICAGQSFTIIPSGASTYTYTGGSAIVSPMSPASYSVTGTDTNGCVSASPAVSNVTVNPLPVVSYSQSPSAFCVNNAAFTLSPGSPVGGIYSGAGVSGNVFDPANTGAGIFTVVYQYTDSNSCTDSVSSTITVNACVGINETAAISNSLTIYPNPASDIIRVSANGVKTTGSLTITNTVGKIVYNAVVTEGTTEISLAGFENGVYFIQLKTTNGIATKKIVKQ
jgi:PKD repeat protein